ncbi:MAG TPA: type II toxin-antitoxin system prevent-host-death family antitoxin [Nitrospiria bacterium]|jgi:prevent-host-death family protein
MKTPKESAVRIAEFKAHLSQYLRNVRRGHPLTLLDRETPIARILPYPSAPGKLAIRKPLRSAKDVHLPSPIKKHLNSLKVLLEERQKER